MQAQATVPWHHPERAHTTCLMHTASCMHGYSQFGLRNCFRKALSLHLSLEIASLLAVITNRAPMAQCSVSGSRMWTTTHPTACRMRWPNANHRDDWHLRRGSCQEPAPVPACPSHERAVFASWQGVGGRRLRQAASAMRTPAGVALTPQAAAMQEHIDFLESDRDWQVRMARTAVAQAVHWEACAHGHAHSASNAACVL